MDSHNIGLLVILVLCGVIYFVVNHPRIYQDFLSLFSGNDGDSIMSDLAWIRLEQTVPGKPINVEYIRGFETNTSSENVIAVDSRIREQPKDVARATPIILEQAGNAWGGRVEYGWKIKLVNARHNYTLNMSNETYRHDSPVGNRDQVMGQIETTRTPPTYFVIKGPTYDPDRTGKVRHLDIIQLMRDGSDRYLGASKTGTPFERTRAGGTIGGTNHASGASDAQFAPPFVTDIIETLFSPLNTNDPDPNTKPGTSPPADDFAEVFGYPSSKFTDWRIYINRDGTVSLQHVRTRRQADMKNCASASPRCEHDGYKMDLMCGQVAVKKNVWSGSIKNKVTEDNPDVGNYGGSCTCPNGAVYQVGDNNDSCGSLACVGGVSGTCNRTTGAWSGQRKVVCDTNVNDSVQNNAPGVGQYGGSCTCPNGAVYQVGDNNDECNTLACEGGLPGMCYTQVSDFWKHRKVTCDANTQNVCTLSHTQGDDKTTCSEQCALYLPDERFFLHGSDTYFYCTNAHNDDCECTVAYCPQEDADKDTTKQVVSCYHETRNDDRQKWVPKGQNDVPVTFTPKDVRDDRKEKIFIQLASGTNRSIKGDFKLERLEVKTSTHWAGEPPTGSTGLVVSLLGRDKRVLKQWPAFVEDVNLYTLYRRTPKVWLEQTQKNTPIKLLQIKAFDTSGVNLISKQSAHITHADLAPAPGYSINADRAKTVKSTAMPLSNILTDSAAAGWTTSSTSKKERIVIDIHTIASIKRIELVQDTPHSLAGLVIKLLAHDDTVMKEWDPLVDQTGNYLLSVA